MALPAILGALASNPQGALQTVGQFAQTAAGLAQTGQNVVGQLRNVFNPASARREQQSAQRNQLLSAVLSSALRPAPPPPPPPRVMPVQRPAQQNVPQPTYIPPPPSLPMLASQSAEVVQVRSDLPRPSLVPGAPTMPAQSTEQKSGVPVMAIVGGGALLLGLAYLAMKK